MKMDALANGVFGQRIDTHSLRAGGAAALYTQGVPLDAIQRRGRWKSLTIHQYLWRDASALNRLSEIVVKSQGLLERLGLMHKNSKHPRFLNPISTMAEASPEPQESVSAMPKSVFLPNGEFRAGGMTSELPDGAGAGISSPSDLPPYTASPDDSMRCTRPLTKRGKHEKMEKGRR